MNSFIMAHKRKKSESSGGSGPLVPDLVSLGILTKQVSEFTSDDIGKVEVSIPYSNEGSAISGPIIFEVVGVNHHTSAAHPKTITLMTKNIIRTAYFDREELRNPNSDRVNGNNRWKHSNIRQWLNSAGAANSWFTAQHEYDTAPTYASEPGFLAGFSKDVLQHFTTITNTTAVPNVDGGGSETTEDKVFLPSWTELLGSPNYDIEEGSHLSVRYPDNNSIIKKWYGSSYYYWLRSPVADTSYYTIIIDGVGEKYSDYVYREYGIAPIIVLH